MISAKSVMTKDVVFVYEHTPIYEALDLLIKNKVSGLPVVNPNHEVVGILSEKDVLRILIDKKLGVQKKVEDYMSRNVVCFLEEDNVVDICKFFIKSPFRRVPIVRENKLVGIVSRREIVHMILEAQSKISDFRYL